MRRGMVRRIGIEADADLRSRRCPCRRDPVSTRPRPPRDAASASLRGSPGWGHHPSLPPDELRQLTTPPLLKPDTVLPIQKVLSVSWPSMARRVWTMAIQAADLEAVAIEGDVVGADGDGVAAGMVVVRS